LNPDVLLAGFGGAFAVFLLGTLREWLQQRRERNGLLRVLFSEVDANQRSVELLLTMVHVGKGETILSLDGSQMSDETWKATRIGLARHLDGKHLAKLTEYYKGVSRLDGFIYKSTDSDASLKALRFMLNVLDERGREVKDVIRGYVPDAEGSRISDEDAARLEKGRSVGDFLEEDK
jgi:hypothetical protein